MLKEKLNKLFHENHGKSLYKDDLKYFDQVKKQNYKSICADIAEHAEVNSVILQSVITCNETWISHKMAVNVLENTFLEKDEQNYKFKTCCFLLYYL